jgi:phosphatidylglycerophosphate synthase
MGWQLEPLINVEILFAFINRIGSKLGEILDMITDRTSIACIIATLCHLYPKYSWLWLLCIALDVGAHWY